MKRCPACQRTYEDGLKFCQVDGTPLADVVSSSGGQTDFDSDSDPMKTMIGVPPDLPTPSPFGNQSGASGNDLNAPSFGDLSSPQPASATDFGAGSQTPSGNFGGGSAPSFQEPDPPFGNRAGYNQSPFGNQPSEWTPPPAPQDWQNQSLGQNTPFSPPPASATGQNNTLGIVSLVSGIIGLPGICCYLGLLLGPVALITGYLQLNNIKKNPNAYGGKGLALAGMIVGGIALVLQILLLVLGIAGMILQPR